MFKVTELVNGGSNEIADRMKYYYLVKEKIKILRWRLLAENKTLVLSSCVSISI